MHYLLSGILAVIVAVIASQPTYAYVQSQRLEDSIYLYYAPFTWIVTEDEDGNVESFWRSKYGALGLIDLRTIPEMSTAGAFAGDEQCCALISSSNLIPELDVEFISQGVNGMTRRGERADIELFRALTEDADPTGQTANKPLIPDRNGVVEAWIAPGTRLFLQSLSRDSLAWSNAMEVHRLDYERIRRENGIETARKVAGYWQLKYGEDIRTVEQQRDGIDDPATSVGDTFARADNSDINASDTGKTLDGGAATWQWNEGATDFRIVSEELFLETGTQGSAAIDQDLSTTDHLMYAIAGTVVNSGSTEKSIRPLTRVDTTSLTAYYFRGFWTDGSPVDVTALYKVVATVVTELTTPEDHDIATGTKLETDSVSSTIEGYLDDVLEATVTDTSITTGLQVGVWLISSGSTGRASIEEVFGEDIAVPESHRIFITHQ